MSWQSDIDAWLLRQGVATQVPCPGCSLAVKPDEATTAIKDGILYHRICFDLSVANLEAELSTVINEENGWTKHVGENGQDLWTPPANGKEPM